MVTNYGEGGRQNGRGGGGQVKFYPYKKGAGRGGRKKGVTMLKGGHNKF